MPFWQRVAEAWGHFLIGSPRRTFVLVGIGFGFYLWKNPAVLASVVHQLMTGLVIPLIQPIVIIAILYWVVRAMVRRV